VCKGKTTVVLKTSGAAQQNSSPDMCTPALVRTHYSLSNGTRSD